ncbi:MAG: hypothetical protein ACI37R_06525 [Candidatus Avigastranaerophilus sp.]
MVEMIPVGLIKPQGQSLENVELRVALEKAVDDANLNVSERLALNKKFFPNGGGFPLVNKNVSIPEVTEFYQKGKGLEQDSFSRELSDVELELQGKNGIIYTLMQKSPKDNFQTNLENALNKLKEVLKGHI